jgi:arylsulfatase A-like enzyme
MSYFDLGFLGQRKFETPNIDKLGREGLFFSEAYSGAPECAPSRASLMTGMHPGHCRIRLNRSARGQDHLLDEDITVAEVLHEAGYRTGFVGKWGIGLPGTEGVPEKQGFDYAFGFYDQRRAHSYYPHFLMENGVQVPLPGNYGFEMEYTYQHSRKNGGLHDYDPDGKLRARGVDDPAAVMNSQDLIHEKAMEFIRNNHDGPFFLYYATQLPHGPCITPDLSRYMDREWDQKHKEWACMMDHLDRHVGELIGLVEDLGLQENTLFLFASDNGYSQWGYFGRGAWNDDPVFHNKGPWRGGKFASYDGGMRVPLIAYWPEIIKSGTSDYPVNLVDFLATASELTGQVPPDNDGLSLVPLLKGEPGQMPEREFLYWGGGTRMPNAQAVRFREWFGLRETASSPLQLWNLIADTGCMVDVADDYTDIVDRLESIMKSEHTDSEWYMNPRETNEAYQSKVQMARESDKLQEPVRPNTTYPVKHAEK